MKALSCDTAKFIYLAAAVILIWLLSWKLIDHYIAPSSEGLAVLAAQGSFGDKFGAVNSLFSGLAFAGIIFTILMQRRELSLQRSEVARNQDQIEKQNSTLIRQRFEHTFFKLMELHSEINSKLELLSKHGLNAHEAFLIALIEKDPDFGIYKAARSLNREQILNIKTARHAPSHYAELLNPSELATLTEALTKNAAALESLFDQDTSMHKRKIKDAYEKTCEKYLQYFAHYFRSLYHILNFIENQRDFDVDDKRLYAKILRSQLSDAELVSLFYNSLMEYDVPGRKKELGFPKLGKMLKEYEILHNMNEYDIIHPVHQAIFKENYAEEAK